MLKRKTLSLIMTLFLLQGFGDEPVVTEDAVSAPEEQESTESEESMEWCEIPSCAIEPLLEFKAGYFFFSDSKMNNIYNKGGIDLQLSGSYPIWRWLQIYGSFEFLTKHGQSINGGQDTSVWEIPLSFGLKPVWAICDWLQYYAAVGPRYVFFSQRNSTTYVDRYVSQNGLGGFVNTGFIFFPWTHFAIDVFGEYSFCNLHFHHHNGPNVSEHTVQVGGFTFGGGLGYSW